MSSVKRNTLWSLLGAGVPLLVAVFSIPYLLRELGAAGFGVLVLVWALIGYFNLFDFGIGRALTYELSRRSTATLSELAPYVRAGIALTCATGIAGAALLALLAKPLSGNWLNIGADWASDAYLAFLIAAVGIVPTTITSGLRGALEGSNRFAASNINRLLTGALMFALPAWSVYFHGPQLWTATLYMVSARLLMMLIVLYQLRQYLLAPGRIARSHLAALLNYGAWMIVTGIVGPLMVVGDRFFVSAAVGAHLLPQYAIPQEALQRLLLLPAALCAALMPQLAALGRERLQPIYDAYFKRVAWSMLAVCSAAAALAYPALGIWISAEFAHSAIAITLVLTLGIWFNAMAMVPYTVLHALGKPKITAIFHLIQLLLYIGFLWLLTDAFGLIGAAMTWTGRVMLDYFMLRSAVRRILAVK